MRAASVLAMSVVLIALLARPCTAAQADFVMKRTTTDPSAKEIPVSVFPHQLHRVLFKCYVCHESIFKMKAHANTITMDGVFNGKFCGVCHNGKTSFAADFGSCDRCHRK